MKQAFAKLTVFFEDPFWIGVCERGDSAGYEACKIVFGAEPKDGEIYDYLLKNYNKLQFSPSLANFSSDEKRPNPKRLQREIYRTVHTAGVGTKAQQTLKLQQEQCKLERKTRSRTQREAQQDLRYTLRRQKQKEKHRGH